MIVDYFISHIVVDKTGKLLIPSLVIIIILQMPQYLYLHLFVQVSSKHATE